MTRVRSTRAQLAEDRRILLEDVRANAPEMADELEASNATYTEVRITLGTLYGERNVVTREIAQLRREAYENGLAWIRETYHVPATLGRKVRYYPANGAPEDGRIVGADGPHLLIRLAGRDCELPYHPTWRIDYLDGEGVRT